MSSIILTFAELSEIKSHVISYFEKCKGLRMDFFANEAPEKYKDSEIQMQKRILKNYI